MKSEWLWWSTFLDEVIAMSLSCLSYCLGYLSLFAQMQDRDPFLNIARGAKDESLVLPEIKIHVSKKCWRLGVNLRGSIMVVVEESELAHLVAFSLSVLLSIRAAWKLNFIARRTWTIQKGSLTGPG
jgi:hypothetical protein